MRRVAYVLTVLAGVCVAAGQAQAHNPYFHNAYHHAYYGSALIRPNVVIAPRVVAPAYVYPGAVYYPPVYGCYPYWTPVPAAGFYYQSRGLSLGVGW